MPRSPNEGGSAFDVVVDNDGSVTIDATHTRGLGLAVKHEVSYHGNAYYGWGNAFTWAPIWSGRVYVWFDSLPEGSVRLVRAVSDGDLRFAIDISPSGALRVRDSDNDVIGAGSAEILTGGWVRIEWMVDHLTGTVDVLLFNSPNLFSATEMLTSPYGSSIGSSTDQVQIGRSGSQRSSTEFWSDDPAIGTGGFLGPVPDP